MKCDIIIKIISDALEHTPKIFKWLKTFTDSEPSGKLVDIPNMKYRFDVRSYETDEQLPWLENQIYFTKYEAVRQLRVMSKYAEAVLQRDEVITIWMP